MLTCISIVFYFPFYVIQAQNVRFHDHQGRVVDAKTGKPLPNVSVSHSIGGQTDAEGRFTVRYYDTESDLRVIISHPGYYSDTFSIAPPFVSLRRLPPDLLRQGRPKVAVVLSGGGAKGVAHIGALRVIEEAGIPIDIICGTSMGSLIGALYSIGYTPEYLDSLVHAQDWSSLLSDRTDPSNLTLRQREEQNTYAIIRGLSSNRPESGGLIRGRNLNRLFRQLCAGYLDSISFDSLPIPFACVATDLVTNTEVDFHNGSLIRAMRASMAIPGVFTPVRIGDMVLVDGGLRNNYPADLARQMGADIIIGVSVQGDPLTADEIGDAATVMMQIIDINTKHKYTENVEISDVFMQVDVHGYSAASFFPTAIDSLITRGEREARKHFDELKQLSSQLSAASSHPIINNRELITADRQPSTDNQQPSTGYRPPTSPIASIGFRFDTEEMGALQINAKLPIHTRLPMGIGGTLRLGRRLMARAEYSILTRRIGLAPTLAYTFRNNDIDLYTNGQRSYNIRYYQHTAEFTPLDLRLRNYLIHAGIRWDYFDYYGQLLTANSSNQPLTDDHYFSYYVTTDLNNENQWYFPSRGTRLHAAYHYRTDNLIGMDNYIGINDLSAHFRVNFPLSRRLTLQPMLYGRILIGDNIPMAFINAVGGEWFAHTVEQQLPFSGIGHIEKMDNQIIAAQLQAHYRILNNHYVLLRVAALSELQPPDFNTLLPNHYSIQAGYSYLTLFGPIDARIGYSNRTNHPYFLINLGHIF
ncbi:MAG: patatin-like phospholipase family protein [Bacteroidales bacterium]|nr:patatin-like phospholipase family protein [Bacteroidales bacterium]